MKSSITYKRVLSLVFTLIVIGCAPQGEDIAGNSSSSPNAFVVTGTAQYEDGSPAAGQPLYLRNDIAANSSGTAVLNTGNDGSFTLTGLPEGDFGIEIRDDGDKAVYKAVALTGEPDTVALPPLVLTLTGAVTGTVACAVDSVCPGYDSLLVSIKGVWRSVWADAQGIYMITGVPEGTYGMRFDAPWAAAQTAIRITEIEGVAVVSDETTYVEKVLLPARSSVADDPAYLADAAVIQAILDNNGITDPLESFTGVQDNRIVVFADETGRISRLPESIGQLDALQVLMLHGGGITEFPAALGDLTGLLRLDLAYQGLTTVPEQIDGLTSLVELNLNGNQLDTLDGIFALENLQFLYLENNNLSILPDSIENLTMLRRLDLSENTLTDLPAAITELPYLDMVDVSGNSLCDPDPVVSAWLDSVAGNWSAGQECGN